MPTSAKMTKDGKNNSGFESDLTQDSKPQTRNRLLLGDLRPPHLGRKQNVHQLIERCVRSFTNFLKLNRTDGMLHNQYRMIRRAKRFFLGLGQRRERVRDQRDREPATLLNLE
jgi:hypothetical protein